MPQQTQQQYYEDESQYGQYQYVTLAEIIDGMLAEVTLNEDHYLKNIKRALLLRYAKNAIREVNRQAASEVLEFEITVPDSLVFPMPQECVNYVGVWRVIMDNSTSSYRLVEVDINDGINTAIGYLQDDHGDLLYDDQGQILMADSANAIAHAYQRYRFAGYYQPTTDASKFSRYGEVKFDKSRGVMVFSSDLSNQEVVIRYVSDGLHASLKESEIRIHKYIRRSVETWIYFEAISRRRNVSASEKQRARIDFNTALHKSKVSLANFDLNQIARIMRSRSMTL